MRKDVLKAINEQFDTITVIMCPDGLKNSSQKNLLTSG